MKIDQVNAGNALTVNNNADFFSVDQWIGNGEAADGVFTLQRSTSTPPTGFTHFLRATVTTADASIGATQDYMIFNKIEGNNVSDLLFGTASAKTITISFWVRSSLTGTFSGVLLNNFARSYPFTYAISVANTWEYKTVSIAGDTSGTWATDTGVGMVVLFTIGAGTSKQGTAGSWSTNNFAGATGSTNLIATNGATLDFTGVQLEIGSNASPFEYRPIALETMFCERYFEKSYPLETAVGVVEASFPRRMSFAQTGATTMQSYITYKTRKRVAATATAYTVGGTAGSWAFRNTGGTDNDRVVSLGETGQNGFTITQTTAVEYLGYGHWTANARL